MAPLEMAGWRLPHGQEDFIVIAAKFTFQHVLRGTRQGKTLAGRGLAGTLLYSNCRPKSVVGTPVQRF
jgi:hypothetical protein